MPCERSVDPELPPVVGDLTDVLELRAGESDRGLNWHLDDRVVTGLVVVRHFQTDPVFEEAGIEADLELGSHFRLEVGITERSETIEQRTREIDRALALDANSQKNRDQFGVRQ